MQYILTERGIDFDAYLAYVETVRDRLPSHVAAFAADPRRFALSDRESLHDSWLESVIISEPATGMRGERRRAEIVLRLLGAFHDRVHVLKYTGVRSYRFSAAAVTAGHGDLYTHEVRLAPTQATLEHELLFVNRASEEKSRLLIECTSFSYESCPVREEAV